eukprot:CAMPEP_0203981006 /NCGR_PEP_ID=MMETSP0360-20130528/1920_1 /ASSEMBLY_ACC=CAM_ASM_000342 /TAXON_ID=268821 /ORGANISM="Scrippsiella Hangoei, Strain SHTV-5" /LENGTH=100 /DNA_ID=CAMNT_0050919505 /DNA_START=42 /DNA_END=341 /DNA_ORIENTATION=-
MASARHLQPDALITCRSASAAELESCQVLRLGAISGVQKDVVKPIEGVVREAAELEVCQALVFGAIGGIRSYAVQPIEGVARATTSDITNSKALDVPAPW